MYLSNFWQSLEIPLINCKVELRLRWTKYCVLSVVANDNDDTNPNDVIFTIKNTKLYVPVVTLSAKDIQKLSKLLSERFERSVYWNKYKAKNENKDVANKYRYFLKSNIVDVDRLLVLIYSERRW